MLAVILGVFLVVSVLDILGSWLFVWEMRHPKKLTLKKMEELWHSVADNEIHLDKPTTAKNVSFHYPLTDEQEERQEITKRNDAKGIDTPIDELL